MILVILWSGMRARVQAEPGVGVDAVELGGFDQGVGCGGGAAASLRADKQVVLAAKGRAAHGAFGWVVDLQDAAIEAGTQPGQPHKGVANGAGEGALAGQAWELRGEPGLEVAQDRPGLGLAQPGPFLRRQTPSERPSPPHKASRCEQWRPRRWRSLASDEHTTNLRRTWARQATSRMAPPRWSSPKPA